MFKTVKNLLNSRRRVLAVSVIAMSASAGFGGLHAQNAAPAASDPFNLPESITMLGQEDPNMRRATAKVNGYVITGTDIDQRLALVLDANQTSSVSDEEMQRLRMQVLRNLIDETLQIQEAVALEVAPDTDRVEATYQRVATQNFGQSKDELDAYLKKVGSSPASLKRQIEGELAWQNILARNVQPFINVSEDEVHELIDRMKASKGMDEYHLGEIYLSSTPTTDEAVKANGTKIMEQLQQGGSFAAYARQFSEASTAAVGGDLGWIRLPQLPAELATITRQLQPGQLAGPIKIQGGYSILYLTDKRQVLTADPRDAILSLKQISITFPQDVTEQEAQARLAEFTKGVESMRGCGDADSIAGAMGAEVVTNDQVAVRGLPASLQDSLLSMQIGQATPPFGSVVDGVRVLMLCGRDDPQVANEPSFNQVMAQLEDERVGKRAQRYLRDLRRDAIIEYN